MANMAQNVGSIYYTVEADVSPLVQAEQQATSSMDKMGKGFQRVDKSANDSTFTLTKTAQAVQSVDKRAAAAQRSLDGLTKLLAGLVTLQGVSGLIQMAEAYGEMAERVQMATSSTEDFNLVQARLLETSNRTYRALSESQEVFVRTSAALKSMGYDLESSLDVTDSLSFAFVKNATSVARATSATDAFSKVLNKGRVEADAWETVLAAIPTVVDDIAAASGKSAEEIRRLGVEGQLTARMLTEGLRASLDQNRKAADGMATTVRDAFTALRNNLSALVGEANRTTGATQVLSKAVLFLADNLQTVVNVLLAAGAGALAKYVAGITASALAQAKAAISARLLASEQLQLAVAEQRAATVALAQVNTTSQLATVQTAAAAATGRLAAANTALAAAQATATRAGTGLLAILGGPAGIVGIIATVAAGVLLFGNNAKNAAPNVDQLAEAVDNLNQAQLDLRRNQVGDAIQQVEKEARDSSRMVSQLTKDIIELDKAKKAGRNIDDEGMRNANASLVEEKANLDEINTRRQKLLELEQKLANVKPRERTSAGPAPEKGDPEVAKRLQSLRDEAELAKLSGAARARLQAIQKLGANATKEEREEAERLATTIYELETAQKKSGETSKKNAEAEKENKKVIDGLATSLYEAGLA
ncbi:tape measure protein, partial [Streptococcus salivarius]